MYTLWVTCRPIPPLSLRDISWPLSVFTTTHAAIKLHDSREGSLSSLVAAKGSESAYGLQQ